MEFAIPKEISAIRSLSVTELNLLADIASFKEYYRPRPDIAKMLQVSTCYVSTLLKRLHQKGLIEKCGNFYNRVCYKAPAKIRRLMGHKVKNEIAEDQIAEKAKETSVIESTMTYKPADNNALELVDQNESSTSLPVVDQISQQVASKKDLKNLCNDLMEYWNKTFADTCVPKVTRMTSKRIAGVKNRLKDKFSVEDLYLAIDKAHSSSFCTSGKWGFAFDWVFCYNGNIIKILEGNYDDKEEKSSFGDFFDAAIEDPELSSWFGSSKPKSKKPDQKLIT